MKIDLDKGEILEYDSWQIAKMKTDRTIKQWMKARGISQRELAQIAGVHESMISRFLNGTRALGLRPLLRLAGAMGVSVEELCK